MPYFDVFFKNILFGQVLYLLFHGQSDCFSFFKCQVQRAHTFYLESHIITLYREKKSLRKCHVPYNDL